MALFHAAELRAAYREALRLLRRYPHDPSRITKSFRKHLLSHARTLAGGGSCCSSAVPDAATPKPLPDIEDLHRFSNLLRPLIENHFMGQYTTAMRYPPLNPKHYQNLMDMNAGLPVDVKISWFDDFLLRFRIQRS